jgi:hypothetical protein
MLPNGQVISGTHTANLPFPQLPTTAILAHIFPHLRNQALLSIGVFCDVGCTLIFEQTSVQIRYNNKLVLEGTQIPPGLWTVSITAHPQANATFLPS